MGKIKRISRPLVSIIIPVYNEEENIYRTIQSLLNQIDFNGEKINNSYQIILVDNNSNDKTISIVKSIIHEKKVKNIFIVHEKTKGIIATRIRGINAILHKEGSIKYTKYLSFCDGDITVQNKWVASIISIFEDTSTDIISFDGTFPFEFWKEVPRLARRYYNEVGDVFFNERTVSHFKFKENKSKFNHTIYKRFIRPVSGGCYAIRSSTYKRSRGYQREFVKKNGELKEVDGPTWRLSFELYNLGAHFLYLKKPFFECSARRILMDPKSFFKIKGHTDLSDLKDYRGVTSQHYRQLEKLSKDIDFTPIKNYVIKYHLIMQCFNMPNLIKLYPEYFNGFRDEIYNKIIQLKKKKKNHTGRECFLYIEQITKLYFKKILRNMTLSNL